MIRAQFGHVSPAMMAVYSHVRRKALDEAAKALEPEQVTTGKPAPEPPAKSDAALRSAMECDAAESRVRNVVRPARLERATSWFVA